MLCFRCCVRSQCPDGILARVLTERSVVRWNGWTVASVTLYSMSVVDARADVAGHLHLMFHANFCPYVGEWFLDFDFFWLHSCSLVQWVDMH